MLEAIDTFGGFEVHPTVVIAFLKAVFVDEFLWDLGNANADIFWTIKRNFKVEVFEICCEKFCIFCEQTLLRTPFTSSSDPVLVPVSPRYEIVLPPMVMWVLLGSSLVGRTLQMTRVCATSDTLSGGILLNNIGRMLLVRATHCGCERVRVLMLVVQLVGGASLNFLPIP